MSSKHNNNLMTATIFRNVFFLLLFFIRLHCLHTNWSNKYIFRYNVTRSSIKLSKKMWKIFFSRCRMSNPFLVKFFRPSSSDQSITYVILPAPNNVLKVLFDFNPFGWLLHRNVAVISVIWIHYFGAAHVYAAYCLAKWREHEELCSRRKEKNDGKSNFRHNKMNSLSMTHMQLFGIIWWFICIIYTWCFCHTKLLILSWILWQSFVIQMKFGFEISVIWIEFGWKWIWGRCTCST